MHTRGTGMQPVFPHPGGGFIHIVHHVIHNPLLFGRLPLCITRPRRWTCRAKNCIILHTPFFAQSGGGWPAVRAPRPDHARACAGGLAFPWRAAASAQRERRATCRANRRALLPRCAQRERRATRHALLPRRAPPLCAPPPLPRRAACPLHTPAPLRPPPAPCRAPALCAPPPRRPPPAPCPAPLRCALPPLPAPPPAAPRGEKALRPPGSPQKDITPPGETHCAEKDITPPGGTALRGIGMRVMQGLLPALHGRRRPGRGGKRTAVRRPFRGSAPP